MCQTIIHPSLCYVSTQSTSTIPSMLASNVLDTLVNCQMSYSCMTLSHQLVPSVTLVVVPHVTLWLVHLYLSMSIPMYHSMLVVWTYDMYNHLPRQHCTDCTDCTVNIFLPIWKNEQIMISWSYDVSLIPFKLHWVCNVEVYTHVHFDDILSTFIFRPSWTPSCLWDPFYINYTPWYKSYSP